jgi:hypothetical protein
VRGVRLGFRGGNLTGSAKGVEFRMFWRSVLLFMALV